jgi:hypothetical protein
MSLRLTRSISSVSASFFDCSILSSAFSSPPFSSAKACGKRGSIALERKLLTEDLMESDWQSSLALKDTLQDSSILLHSRLPTVLIGRTDLIFGVRNQNDPSRCQDLTNTRGALMVKS